MRQRSASATLAAPADHGGQQLDRLAVRRGAAGALAIGAQAVGACALGALAVGAFAIRRLAIGRVGVGHAAVHSLEIEQLSVKRLRVQTQEPDGIVNLPSKRSVEDTVARLQAMLHERGITLFALIDHSAEAEKAGLKMRPTKLLIFGSPQAGTPLMLATPSLAIDLPLKLLVWEDAAGKVWVGFNSPEYLRDRHHLPQELVGSLAAVCALAERATE